MGDQAELFLGVQGSGGGVNGTTVVARQTKPAQKGGDYRGCGQFHTNRVGFVLGSQNHIAGLHYVGFDTRRYPDSHPLCGGAPFETPGCAAAYCNNASNASFLIGGGEGVEDVLVEDVSVAGGTMQNGFWMPQTVSKPCRNVTVRGLVVRGNCSSPGPCTGSGTWADGLNVHGAHADVLIEGCIIKHTGDDGFAVWSAGASETNITFKNNLATFPRYPKTWLASCFAQYGGNRTAFLGNRCVGTGERGMIYFEQAFNGVFAKGASCDVVNNTQDDERKPMCGGQWSRVNAPGCTRNLTATPPRGTQ